MIELRNGLTVEDIIKDEFARRLMRSNRPLLRQLFACYSNQSGGNIRREREVRRSSVRVCACLRHSVAVRSRAPGCSHVVLCVLAQQSPTAKSDATSMDTMNFAELVHLFKDFALIPSPVNYANLLDMFVMTKASTDGAEHVAAINLLSFGEFTDLLCRVAARMPPDAHSKFDRPEMCPLSLMKRLFRHLDRSPGLSTLLKTSRVAGSTSRLRKYVAMVTRVVWGWLCGCVPMRSNS